jgi:hypothetical protein
MSGGAREDRTGRYRLLLWRAWAGGEGCVVFVMLNPSTADARRDDPTVRRCMGFARAWGFGRLEVVNLFALRATDPTALRRARKPIGRGNDRAIVDAVRRGDVVVAAWGVHGALGGRDAAVRALLADRPLHCLGVTRGGHPRHPLYLRAGSRPVPFVTARCQGLEGAALPVGRAVAP